MIKTVRMRLTLWYILVFGLLLAGFSAFIYAMVSHSVSSRQDNLLISSARAAVTSFRAEMDEPDGRESRKEQLRTSLLGLQLPEVSVAVFDSSGQMAADDGEAKHRKLIREIQGSPEFQGAVRDRNHSGNPRIFTLEAGGKAGARVVAIPFEQEDNGYVLIAALSLKDKSEQLETLALVIGIGLPLSLLVAAIGGFLMARKSLSPVVSMSTKARRISATNLHERLDIANPDDELGLLGSSFNELLSRLDLSFEKMRQFMADASHELRTPLAIIKGETDVVLSKDRDPAEYRESLNIIQDETKRLCRMVDDMLSLARADAGQHRVRSDHLYIDELVEDCLRTVKVLAAGKSISINAMIQKDLFWSGDEELLRRALMNLLDNAVKYTPEGGAISVELKQSESSLYLTVSDTGIGIPAECLPHVFERFYRSDRARTRNEGGTGLGLSICKWAVEANGGSIEVDSEPGRGSTFTIVLPAKDKGIDF